MKITKPPTQKQKLPTVSIKAFHPQALPTEMGGLQITIWGLGDDDNIYLYDTKKQAWLEANG